MRNRQQGYAVWTDAQGRVQERETFTCSHCSKLVAIKPASDPSEAGGFCRVCMKLTCGPCTNEGRCLPFEKKLEMMEKRAYQNRKFHEFVGTKK